MKKLLVAIRNVLAGAPLGTLFKTTVLRAGKVIDLTGKTPREVGLPTAPRCRSPLSAVVRPFGDSDSARLSPSQ